MTEENNTSIIKLNTGKPELLTLEKAGEWTSTRSANNKPRA